jgi:hypothetical protein
MALAQLPLRWRVLTLPRGGHTAEEYEDAWAADSAVGRFAVADGATESSFSALWARLLTEGYLGARCPRDLAGWLSGASRRWAEEVAALDLPWYAEMKREEGAFATLLGLSARGPTGEEPGRWRAVAVGDSCLLRVRKDCRVDAFPIRQSSDFGNQPRLIGSRQRSPLAPLYCSGSMRTGDRFFLMTDALAQWFLSSHETGGRPWEAVDSASTAEQPQKAFSCWIEELRARGALRNDDVTLMWIESGSGPTE